MFLGFVGEVGALGECNVHCRLRDLLVAVEEMLAPIVIRSAGCFMKRTTGVAEMGDPVGGGIFLLTIVHGAFVVRQDSGLTDKVDEKFISRPVGAANEMDKKVVKVL